MRKLLALLLLFLASANSWAGTVVGQVQNASGGSVANGVFSFTLTQGATVSGTASVVSSSVFCYTDGNGNVVGEPNPLVLPVLSANTASGTLAAATYFVKLSYFDLTGESIASSEQTVILGSTGSIIVTAPVKQPAGATGYKVYISTASGTETLQGSITGTPGSWANFTQSVPLVSGAALPSSNTTACKLRFNDELTPSFVCYDVGLSSSTGNTIPGFPQYWYMSGGSSGSINIGLGTPQSNVCQGAGVFYPQAILTQPPFNATQFINGGLGILPSSGNVAIKNAAADHIVYLSSSGSDSNEGHSWGEAKLTSQAAFNLATNSGANPGTVLAACGTYAGPTTWYSNLNFEGLGSSDASGINFAVTPLNAAPCVKVTYSSTVTLTSVQNTFVRNVFFDFANSGAGFVLNSASSNHFDDTTFNLCGNASTPCVLMKTIDSAGPGHNTDLNVFRGVHCIANNLGSGANATCFKFLGAGAVNCSGACAGVTLNRFYNTVCAGGVLHCIDFELNSDSNYFYDVNCNQDVPLAGSSCISFNELTPASDQDADGEFLTGVCLTGTFSAPIRAGQTNGSVLQLCSGVNGLPLTTVLGGTPTFDIFTVGLAGTTKTTAFSGTLGVLADATLTVPPGAVAGDMYAARNATTGAYYLGTDGQATLLRAGTQWKFLLSGGGIQTSIPAVNTADAMGLVPVVGTPIHLTGIVANVSATPIGTIGTNIVAGTYAAHVSCITTGSGTGTTATPTLSWTDAGGAKTLTLASFALNSVTITGYDNAVFPIHPSSGAVNFAATGTFGSSVAACDAWLTREN